MNFRIVAVLASIVAAAAVLPAPASAAPAAASAFSWSLNCVLADASVSWVWLENGIVIEEGAAYCDASSSTSLSGSGTRPANATAFSATLTQSPDGDSVSKEFAVGKGFKVQLDTSTTFIYRGCGLGTCLHLKNTQEAHFNFSS